MLKVNVIVLYQIHLMFFTFCLFVCLFMHISSGTERKDFLCLVILDNLIIFSRKVV